MTFRRYMAFLPKILLLAAVAVGLASSCGGDIDEDEVSGVRRVEALQSLSGEPRQLTSHYNNDGTVTFTWDSMLGGELVPIKIMK